MDLSLVIGRKGGYICWDLLTFLHPKIILWKSILPFPEEKKGLILAVYSQIPAKLKKMFDTIGQKECPEVTIGMHCLTPYECPLKDYCWAFLPKRSIFNLYWLGKEKKFELLEQGLKTIEEIPDYFALTDKQRIQKHAIRKNEAYIDRDEIRSFLRTLACPLYYLDFETFSPAIPLYDGSRPYQKIPFQYSLHVVQEGGVPLEHFSFLSDGTADPRPGFLQSLKEAMGRSGSVVVYNQKFEEGILNELAGTYPEHESWIKNVIGRMVDLLEPFQAFHYYHPDQNGSASLKSVLPALTGNSYEGMNIQEGDEASRIFVNTFLKDQFPGDREQIS